MADEEAEVIVPATPVGADGFFRNNEGAKPFEESTWDQMLAAIGVAPDGPLTAALLNTLITGGATYVSLANISVIDTDVRIPYGVAWDPPSEGSPLTFSGGSVLTIDGPCARPPGWKIFDSVVAGDVRGHFAGQDINVGWWSGFDPDALANVQPHIEAACTARNPGNGSDTLAEWNAKLDLITFALGGSIAGGRVVIPAGLWDVTAEINMGGKYIQLEGMTYGAGLRFTGVASGAGFRLTGAATNTVFRQLALFIEDDCHASFDLFDIDSGVLEGSVWEHLITRGCKRYLFNLGGTSTNHFTIRRCHFLGPHEDASTAVFGRSFNRFTWEYNSLVKSGGGDGYWDRGVDLSGYDRVTVRDSHFEAVRKGCVVLSDERDTSVNFNGCVVLSNLVHNYGNTFWDTAWSVGEATQVDLGEFRNHNSQEYRCILAHTPSAVGATGEPGVGATWATYWEVDDGGAVLWVRKDPAAATPAYAVSAEGLFCVEGNILIKDDGFTAGEKRSGGNTDLDGNGELKQTLTSSVRVARYVRTKLHYELHTTKANTDATSPAEITGDVTDQTQALVAGLYEVTQSGGFGGGTLTIEDEDDNAHAGLDGVTVATTRTIWHTGGNVLITLAGSTTPTLTVTFTRQQGIA
jgi:hypothetical protein